MAAMTGFFDDSRTDGEVFAVAGLIGNTAQWDFFEQRWASLLDRHGVPYLHMKEMPSSSGPYAKWVPAKDHEAEIRDFFIEVTNAINDCGFDIFGTIIRLKDLNRFNSEKRLSLEPYALAVYACMAHIKTLHPDKVVDLVFDSIERVHSRLEKATAYADSDCAILGIADFIIAKPLPKKCSFRNIRAMQAADFIVWEMRKHHLGQAEWWERSDLPANWNDRFADYQNWSRDKFGTNLPPARKSIAAVAKHRPFHGSVFDYRGLCLVNDARNGIWSSC
jgi:hypothetical protein